MFLFRADNQIKFNYFCKQSIIFPDRRSKKTGKQRRKKLPRFFEIYKLKVEIECSNISSSRLSFSDDVQKDEERENEKNN